MKLEVRYCRKCGTTHEDGPCPRRKAEKTAPAPRGEVTGGPKKIAKVAPAGPKKRAARGTFDRGAYQRDYMRDRKLAKALGLTVAQYRAQRGIGV